MPVAETNTNSSPHILVVDDDENLRLIVADRLASQGYKVDQCVSLGDCLDQLSRDSYQLVLLDIYLPDQNGIEGLKKIHERQAALPVIMMTAHGTIDLAVRAMKQGAYDFITKPFDFDRMIILVERAIESNQLRTEVQYLRRAVDTQFIEIIGERTGLKNVLELVQSVANTDTIVLLRGETGTGKEVIARAIHRASSRRDRPFVVANCAAIPRDLMESEMFGHVRGAFTGAVSTHAGFFETAGNGSLLLDEIGDLNIELQAKILRVLEDGSFRKVGSPTTLSNRARIIASTHQPLEKMIEDGRFRSDLFYRLNVFPIELPALRDRREDIPSLAHHFLHRACPERRLDRPAISDDATQLLSAHHWPGNLRELRNCLERLTLTVNDRPIEAADVKTLLQQQHPGGETSLIQPLKDLEEQAIRSTLAKFGGNRTHAAEALGIGRRTLQNKLKLYGLAEEENTEAS